MPGRNVFEKQEDFEDQSIALLTRIATALEEANHLNAPAAEINAFNLKQLKAATEGGILSTPGQLIRK